MPYIYTITNRLNNKKYIGQTSFDLDKRWKQHLQDARRDRCKNRPLYIAINQYGSDNFDISVLEECTREKADERERYWIEKYRTFKYGYNATFGGDGKRYVDHDLVLATYERTKNQNETARLLNIHQDTVADILRESNVSRRKCGDVTATIRSKPIYATSKSGQFVCAFASITSAAKWVADRMDNHTSIKTIHKHIQENCNGKRKSAYGIYWQYDLPP